MEPALVPLPLSPSSPAPEVGGAMEEATRELTRETDSDLSSGFQPHLPPGLSPSPTQGYVRSQKPQR